MRRALPLLLAAACATGYRTPEQSEPMARGIGDRNVESRVRLALARDPETAPYEGIGVRCAAGVVTLDGEVDRAGVRRRAVELAKAVPGVVRVLDRITTPRS